MTRAERIRAARDRVVKAARAEVAARAEYLESRTVQPHEHHAWLSAQDALSTAVAYLNKLEAKP